MSDKASPTGPEGNDSPRISSGAVKTILELGEEKLGEVVNQLLANEAFVAALQKTIAGSLGAKRSVDKGVTTLLGMINIPTLDDVDKIRDKMNELEEVMAEIGGRLGSLNDKLSTPAATTTPGPRKPKEPKEPK